MKAGGQSRVYLGDVINTAIHVNGMDLSSLAMLFHEDNCSSLQSGGLVKALASQGSHPTTKTVQLGVTTIWDALKYLFAGGMVRWATLFSTLRLPKQLLYSSSLAVFEDVWGRRSYIDPRFVTDWVAFELVLGRQFEDRRGSARVKDGKYRLMDRRNNQLINPRHLSDFKVVFGQGCYLRTTMHFDQGEVRLDSCPKCRTQISLADNVETICPRCDFSFIAEKDPKSRCRNLGESWSDIHDVKAARKARVAQKRVFGPSCEDSDRPEHFIWISISAVTHTGAGTKGSECPSPPLQQFFPVLQTTVHFSEPCTVTEHETSEDERRRRRRKRRKRRRCSYRVDPGNIALLQALGPNNVTDLTVYEPGLPPECPSDASSDSSFTLADVF